MLLLKALQYLKPIHANFIHHCADPSLQSLGYMHEGATSTRLGMSGIPEIAEHVSLQNAITMAQYAESKIHLSGISTSKSVAMIKEAKKKNKNLTCSVAWHNLLWTDEALSEYDSLYKVLPPLRTEKDRQSLITGIKEGTIDVISSYHHPQNWDRKNVEFAYASYGMSTISKIFSGLLRIGDPEEWIQCLTTNPRKIFGLERNILSIGEKLNISIFDTKDIATEEAKSAAINIPFEKEMLMGKTLMVINNGEVKNYVSK
jgi:dihydroorotase